MIFLIVSFAQVKTTFVSKVITQSPPLIGLTLALLRAAFNLSG